MPTNTDRTGSVALTLAQVPSHSASWYEICDFALTFDGYKAAGSFQACAAIANERRHDTLDDLRTCLFFEARSCSHTGSDPTGEALEYIRGVVSQIRERLGATAPDSASVDIPPEVADRLGNYVYLYVDPRDGKPFYVGKGRGRRVLAHLLQEGETRKLKTIESIRAVGLHPRLEVLAHGLADEETAFRVESAAIDLLGLKRLTNEVRGWKSVQAGRMGLEQLIAYYAAPPAQVTDPALLIRINRLYRHGMTPDEIYDVTRGVWKLGSRREQTRLALAVFEGVVREVFEIEQWHRAGTTPYRDRELTKLDGRWEFTGKLAGEPHRSRYRGKSVAAYFKKGLRSPVVYAGF